MEDLFLRAAQEGNEHAFARIVETYEKQVYSLCYRMTGSPEDAADQTQETFLKAWRALPSFQGGCALSTWLHRLAVNCCIDFLRRESRHRANVVPLTGEDGAPIQEPPSPDPSPEQRLEQSELHAAVGRALLRLTLEHRQVLLLREQAGLSYDEIAEALSLETGTVKSRIARARLKLREEMRWELS